MAAPSSTRRRSRPWRASRPAASANATSRIRSTEGAVSAVPAGGFIEYPLRAGKRAAAAVRSGPDTPLRRALGSGRVFLQRHRDVQHVVTVFLDQVHLDRLGVDVDVLLDHFQ